MRRFKEVPLGPWLGHCKFELSAFSERKRDEELTSFLVDQNEVRIDVGLYKAKISSCLWREKFDD
jgi:hypothetical protein